MSAPMAATRMVTIMVSNMPVAPVPMDVNALTKESVPAATPVSSMSKMPIVNTRSTFMPVMARMSTTKYGTASTGLNS